MLNKKTLVKAILCGVVATNIFGTVAFAAPGPVEQPVASRESIEVNTTTDANGIKDPNLNHTYFNTSEHHNVCGEKIDNTDLTIGQLNTVIDDLVSNDQTLNSKISNEATARQNGDIVSGSVNDGSISLVKGDGSTIDIDVSNISTTDTYVTAGSYDGDSQKITLERNDGDSIEIGLTNVAKASDVTDLGDRVTTVEGDVNDLTTRVTTNETNISNLDNRVTTVEGDVTNVKNNITTIDNRVTTVEGEVITSGNLTNNTINLVKDNGDQISIGGVASVADVQKEKIERQSSDIAILQIITEESDAREDADEALAGADIASGSMNGNQLILQRYNEETITIDGIATTGNVKNLEEKIETNKETIRTETEERKAEDARLDNRIDGIEMEMSGINNQVSRMNSKINKGVALAIAHASLKPLDFDPEYKWSGTLGMGNYHGENAAAAGVFYQPDNDTMFNLSISTCGSEKGVGAGVSFRFK